MIYRTHDINDPILQDAVKQFANGNLLQNDGYDVVWWTHNMLGDGEHGEDIVNGVIKSAIQRYRPHVTTVRVADEEVAQSCGFRGETDEDERFLPDGSDYSETFRKCMKYNYSRPPNTMSPDISN